MSNWQQMLAQAAKAYGTNAALLREVNQLENSGRASFDVNDWDSNAKAGIPSAGPFQFIKDTFVTDAQAARAANPSAWKGVPVDWKNPLAQALAASWAFKNGKGGAWSTYKQAVAKAGTAHDGGGKAAAPSQTLGMGDTEVPGTDLQSQIDQLQSVRDNLRSHGQPSSSSSSLRDRTNSLRSQREAMDAQRRSQEQANADASDTATPAAADPAVPTGDGANTYKDILQLGKQFGLRIDGSNQTTGGGHAAGSYHYQGRAVDFGDAKNSTAQLDQLASWAKAHAGSIKELFYNPLGWGIKNGKIVKGLTVAGHDDHLHIAM